VLWAESVPLPLTTHSAGRLTHDGGDVALAYQALRNSILHGDISAGTTMSLVELAKRLGFSRTPLREAVRFLQHEGLVHVEPNRRLRVSSLSVADVEQLYVMRIVLEVAAMQMTVPNLRPADVAEARGLIAQMEYFAEERDFIEFEGPHRRFHALFVSAAGERLERMIEELSDHAERYRRAYLDSVQAAYTVSMAEHREILAAAAARDGRRAGDLLAKHYWRTANSVIRELDPAYDPQDLEKAMAIVRTGTSAPPGRRQHSKPPRAGKS
jgi:DNA-binding GntR family transcriptional regulator